MKVGDLVTLSSRGKKQDQNRAVCEAKFGMIMEIIEHGDGTRYPNARNCTKPLIKVRWYYPETTVRYSPYHCHWRYEIKKLKAQSKQ
jgi:hypothetical protein